MLEFEDGDFGETPNTGNAVDTGVRSCPHCAKPVDAQAATCPHCEQPLEETIEVDLNRAIPNRPLRRLLHPRNVLMVLVTVAFALGAYGMLIVRQLSSGYYIASGDRVLAEGDAASAVDFYRQAVQVDAQDAEAYEKLAWAEYQLARDVEALADFESALRLDSDRTSSLFGAGLAAYQLRKYEVAVEHLSRAVTLSPEHADAYQYLGLAEYRLGDLDPAYEHLTEAWVYDPNDGTTLFYLGRLLAVRGKPQVAVERFNEAERSGFDLGSVEFARGLAWMQAGEYEQARNDLQKAENAYPSRVEVKLSLARALYLLEEYDSARDLLTSVQTSLPSNFQQEYLALSGWVSLRQGQFEAARYDFNLWVGISPNNVDALNALGWATYYAGECQMAGNVFEQAVAAMKDEWVQTHDLLNLPDETPLTGLALGCQ